MVFPCLRLPDEPVSVPQVQTLLDTEMTSVSVTYGHLGGEEHQGQTLRKAGSQML